jgi:hypothetical protein
MKTYLKLTDMKEKQIKITLNKVMMENVFLGGRYSRVYKIF